jgi:Predicted Zn-dependent proteases and their inactivated homologs
MEELLRNAGQLVLNLVRQQGLEGEAYLLYERELSIEISAGQVDTLKEAEQMGMGLRVFNSGRMGFAYSSDLSAEALKQVVNNAISISTYTASDQFNRFHEGGQTYPALQTYNRAIATAALEHKIDMAVEAERTARAFDRRIKLVEQSGYEDSDFANLIMNTRGLHAFSRGSYCGLNISLAAMEDDDTQNGFAFMIKKDLVSLDSKAVGEEAAMKAVRSLHARTIPSGYLPCVMDSYVVTRFTGLLSSSLQADAMQKGKSMLAGKEGQQVASARITLVDDATYAEGIASFPFDGEGVASQRNVLIEGGQLQGFLYDTYTGLKAGRESSGNAVRGSFRGLPGVGTTNFMLGPGQRTPASLMADIEKGLFITDVMGIHTANPISGDFSLGAAGIMIEHGQLTYPVRGITIAGNLFTMLQDIDAVASDLRFYGGKAAPAVRLQSISIGGH